LSVTWNNVAVGVACSVMALIVPVIALATTWPVANQRPVVTVIEFGCLAGGVWVSVVSVRRCMRMGVYARPEGLEIRGLARTRVVPWTTIAGTTTARRATLSGSRYYVPALRVRAPQRIDERDLVGSLMPADRWPGRYRVVSVELTSLPSFFEETAQELARRVQLMIDSRLRAT